MEHEKKERMANLEALRCIAMMMVITLHYLGKGNLLPDLGSGGVGYMGAVMWMLESFCIVAVNVYMFISGYFICTSSFKLSRLLQLWLQVWVYSVVFGLILVLQGGTFDKYYLQTLLFPITREHYWFMSAYVFLYLFLPLIGIAVKKMAKQQMQLTLALLLIVFCVSKSVLPTVFQMIGKGYDYTWYVCVFLTAAYVRRFGVPFLEKKGRGVLVYVGGCLLIFMTTFLFRLVYSRTGRFFECISMCMDYNHILPYLAAIGLFSAFRRLRIQGRFAKIVNRIAPHTLGVYLLHENLYFRYSWQKWLGAEHLAEIVADGTGGFAAMVSVILGIFAAVLVVFICGILVDMVRKWLFDGLHRILLKTGLYRRLMGRVETADALFR